jgi:hypothetical protein
MVRMKWKCAATCMIAGIVGFLSGLLTARSDNKPSILAANTEIRPENSVRSITAEEGAGPDLRPHRQASRKDKAPAGDEPRVSIPLKAVSAILKESQFAYSDFEDINRKMPDALTILGVSSSDKKAALDVMTASRLRMFEEEKTHVRIATADENGITLDRSEMDEPSKQVIANTQKGLRESLPSDIAELLIGSIDWERYYFNTTKSTSFRITRSANGSLAATTTTGTGSMSSGLRAAEHPDDGTPIPAESVFDKRWSSFLEGKRLLPVNN